MVIDQAIVRSPRVHGDVVKRCACGRTHTYQQWRRLPWKGEGEMPWGEIQEYRDCACGSTIVVLLAEGEPE